jgi:UDP-galactose transporter
MISKILDSFASPKGTLKPSQYMYLTLLMMYTSGLSNLMHRSRRADPNIEGGGLYFVPTSIFIAELLKLLISIGMESLTIARQASISLYSPLLRQSSMEEGEVEKQDDTDETAYLERSGLLRSFDHLWRTIFTRMFYKGCWRLGVPAALYVAQNILQVLSLTAVSAVVYQALTQFKLLAATVLSSIIFSRTYSRYQWLSIVVLVGGIMMISFSKSNSESANIRNSGGTYLAEIIGAIFVIVACSLGSGAAVYMEKILKEDVGSSLWLRNAQLSFFSLIPAGIIVMYDANARNNWNLLQYFGFWAWATVIARSLGGFLIALVLKRTDSVLKGIATSLALVLTIAIDSIFFDAPIQVLSLLGAFVVVWSSFVYIRYQASS